MSAPYQAYPQAQTAYPGYPPQQQGQAGYSYAGYAGYPYGYDYYNQQAYAQAYYPAGAGAAPPAGPAPPANPPPASTSASAPTSEAAPLPPGSAPPLPPSSSNEEAAPPPPPGEEAAPGATPPSKPAPPSGPPPASSAPASTTAPAAQPGTDAAGASAAPSGYDAAAYQQYYNYYYGTAAQGQAAYAGQSAAYPYHYGYTQTYPSSHQYPQAQQYGTTHHQPQPPTHPPPQGASTAAAPSSSTPNGQHQPSHWGSASSSASQQHQHQSYNAVPPPSQLTGGNTAQRPGQAPFTIKPQWGKQMKPTSGPAYTKAVPATPAANTTSTPGQPVSRAPGAARTTTPSGPVHASSSAGAASASKPKFPPSFTAWVERCFSRCRVDAERQAMTGKLTQKIKTVEEQGRMWLVDWDTEPVPSLTGNDEPSDQHHHQTSGTPTGRSKRSRWAEPEAQQNDQQQGRGKQQRLQQQQQGSSKKTKRAAAAAAAAAASWGNDESDKGLGGEKERRILRAGRFGDGRASGGVQSWERIRGDRRHCDSWYDDDYEDEDAEFDLESLTIKGTCQELEKSYFRLTAPPDPSTVRPEPVLKRALDRLVRLYREGVVNYFYACDQFKGMRQDCTVQHLRNELAVEVYEAHARAALEYGDLAEFNQCQTQLHMFYADGVKGCRAEFTAYKLLYHAVHSKHQNRALLHTMQGLSVEPELGNDGAVQHALKVREAIMTSTYGRFFTLYGSAPGLGRALMDAHAGTARWAALNVLAKVYKTNLPVVFLASLLGFLQPEEVVSPAGGAVLPGCRHLVFAGKFSPAADKAGAADACAAWLQAHGAALEESASGTLPESETAALDVKGSVGKLFIPEEPKVAHGDENLSLEDFLASASRRAADA